MGETHLYDFVRGPLLWIAVSVFVGGIVFRTVQFFWLTRKKDSLFYLPRKTQDARYGRCSGDERKMRFLVAVRNSILGSHPGMVFATALFHGLIFILPIFLLAHNLLLYEAWHFRLVSFSEGTADVLTILFLLLAMFFLLRRMLIAKVRALSSASDYLVWFITVAPFATGFMCYRQWFDYDTVLFLHILLGEVMLMAITFTKLGHMIFFFLARFFISSEYSLGRGTRTW